MLKTVEVISLGRNKTSVALFEHPIKLLSKMEKDELAEHDIIGFGAYKNLFQIRFIDEFATPKKKKKPKVSQISQPKTVVYFSESEDEGENDSKENQGFYLILKRFLQFSNTLSFRQNAL